jgi:2-hydroxy-3-keto-5-methylthiopentenyl-1-phosphate phosphatase
MNPGDGIACQGILVSDFDGTMTRRDFFQIALEHLLPADIPNYWDDYLSGRRTHFETLQVIYGSIRADEAAVRAVLPLTELDPDLGRWARELQARGWRIIVASAGCDWYIRQLLQQQGLDLEVYSNPGRFEPGRGLVMTLPVDSPFLSPTHGIDKAAIVQHALRSELPVAFAGDGYPDIDAALLVPANLRFARAALAESLQRQKLPFRPFQRWSEVAQALLE